MTQSEARARVSKGALHLDQVRPGWAWQIDPGTLDLASQCFCVLGQLHGFYAKGLSQIPLNDDGNRLGWAYGFDITAYDYLGITEAGAAYRMLQDCWIEEIANRLLPSSVEGQPAAV